MNSQDSLLVRATDSLSKGCEFKSQQGRQENFLLQSYFCVLTLIWCLFHSRVTAVAHKRSWSFCQKCRLQVTPKYVYTFDPTFRVGWLWCRCPGIVWEPIRKWAHKQLIREHSVTVVSARWVTVVWSWPEEWFFFVRELISFKKKKKKMQTEIELSNILPKFLHLRKKPPPPTLTKQCLGFWKLLHMLTSHLTFGESETHLPSVFIWGMLTNKQSWHHDSTIHHLKTLFPYVSAENSPTLLRGMFTPCTQWETFIMYTMGEKLPMTLAQC